MVTKNTQIPIQPSPVPAPQAPQQPAIDRAHQLNLQYQQSLFDIQHSSSQLDYKNLQLEILRLQEGRRQTGEGLKQEAFSFLDQARDLKDQLRLNQLQDELTLRTNAQNNLDFAEQARQAVADAAILSTGDTVGGTEGLFRQQQEAKAVDAVEKQFITQQREMDFRKVQDELIEDAVGRFEDRAAQVIADVALYTDITEEDKRLFGEFGVEVETTQTETFDPTAPNTRYVAPEYRNFIDNKNPQTAGALVQFYTNSGTGAGALSNNTFNELFNQGGIVYKPLDVFKRKWGIEFVSKPSGKPQDISQVPAFYRHPVHGGRNRGSRIS